jgi:low affinity Fe/Cu permease
VAEDTRQAQPCQNPAPPERFQWAWDMVIALEILQRRRTAHVDKSEQQMTRPWGGERGSKAVHLLQEWSARTSATGLAVLVSIGVLVTAGVSRHGSWLLVWFEAAASAITLVMVFVLQHTQTLQQVALQHKLDELIRAIPGTDERLIKLEAEPLKVIEEIVKTEGPSHNPNPERN